MYFLVQFTGRAGARVQRISTTWINSTKGCLQFANGDVANEVAFDVVVIAVDLGSFGIIAIVVVGFLSSNSGNDGSVVWEGCGVDWDWGIGIVVVGVRGAASLGIATASMSMSISAVGAGGCCVVVVV